MSDNVEQRFENDIHTYIHTYISNIVKICLLRAELFHSDGRTDVTKLTVALYSFANEPENVSSIIGMAGGMD